MNLGVTLKAAEKVFGPALPGPAEAEKTLAAVHFAAGKGKKFAGVLGMRDDAVFQVHFPTPIDWSLLTSKKGTPDHVNDLKMSGPQGEQGRERLVAEFLEKYEVLRAKKEKKVRDEQRKREAPLLRQRYAHWVGQHEAVISIGGESLTVPVKVTKDKSGKIKFAGVL
jgi:hypothetical protein